jgi:hypothetical protein
VTGGWRKLRDEELHNLYSSPNIIRTIKEDEMGRTCSTHEEDDICKILVGKFEVKRPLGRLRPRWG